MNAPPMPPGMAPAPMAPAKPKSSKPVIAGVMYILALLIGLWQTMSFYSAYQLINSPGVGGIIDPASMGFLGMFSGVVFVFLILSIIGVVGCLLAMIFSFTRKKFPIAVLGGALGFVGLHFLFGLIGFILLVTSKDEFE